MSGTMALAKEEGAAVQAHPWTREQVELIKRTVAIGATDDELKLFLYTAQRMGLDPLAKQIHAVKRWSGAQGREVMAIQVGIDGYRLVADRTGQYAPGPEPKILLDEQGFLVSATAYVKKLVAGTWIDTAATAHYEEYVQRTKDGQPNSMWGRMPKSQLAKCAEALALRKAFPAELSGVYTDDEMAQADNPHPDSITQPASPNPALPQAAQAAPATSSARPSPQNGGRASLPACPRCKKQATVMISKRPENGQYYCFPKAKEVGCGLSFSDSDIKEIASWQGAAPRENGINADDVPF